MSSFSDHIYARQKLTDAIEALAVGEEEVRSRLITALNCVAALREEQVPESHRNEYASILRACGKSGPIKDKSGEIVVGAFQHTLGSCRKRTAAKLAKRIFDLHWEVNRSLEMKSLTRHQSQLRGTDAPLRD